jgi:NADPH:quinone reductase-like Zn-dependent oxidoreductase
MRSLRMPLGLGLPMRLYNGVRRPGRITILGQELAGEVEAVGGTVRSFRPGDPVFGTAGMRLGAYAEYICLPEEGKEGALAIMPANMSYEEAAAVPTGGLEALHFLKRADLRSGETVLINGAGGSIGTYAVQLAKHFGADVTAVDSTDKLEMLRAIGADRVIDYTQEDFTRSGRAYDVIFDVVGKIPFARGLEMLNSGGRYLLSNPSPSHLVRGPWTSKTGDKKVVVGTSNQKTEDLVFLRGLIEAGKIRPVIDRRYPLEEMAEAHRYVETGQKQGNVVIILGDDSNSSV